MGKGFEPLHVYILFLSEGSDYSRLSQVLWFDSAQQTLCLNLSILDDTILEDGIEKLLVLISSSDPDSSINLNTTSVFIKDDDSKCTLLDRLESMVDCLSSFRCRCEPSKCCVHGGRGCRICGSVCHSLWRDSQTSYSQLLNCGR